MDIEWGGGAAQGWAVSFQTCTYVFCSVLFYAVVIDVHFGTVVKGEPTSVT